MQKSNILFHIMISFINFFSVALVFGVPDYSTHLLLGLQVQDASLEFCILRNLEFFMFFLSPFYLRKEFMIPNILEERVCQATGARGISW